MTASAARKVVARNRKARHDFEILQTLEAGMVLKGTEVKSLRDGKATLAGAYVRIDEDEAWLVGGSIPEYRHGNIMNHEPERRRKLLLHRQEIRRLHARVKQERLTLVPLELYFKGPRAKLEIALVQGRKRADKRQALAKREAGRDMARAQRRRR